MLVVFRFNVQITFPLNRNTMQQFKLLLIISFVLLSYQLFSQDNSGPKELVCQEKKSRIDFDVSDIEDKARADSEKLYIKIFNIDPTNIKAYDCIPNYNFELFEIRFHNYIGNESQLFVKLKNNSGRKDTTTSLLRSALYIFCANDSMQSLILKNKNYLSLEEFQTTDGVKSFRTTGIPGQEMFCWKLNQILHFVENHKEVLKHKSDDLIVEQKIDKTIAVNLHSAFPVFHSMASTNKMYKNSISMNSIPVFLGLDVQFVKKNFSFGLGAFHSTFNFNNSLKNTSYTIDWSNANIKGNNFKAIDFKNVNEIVSFSNYNIYLPLTYSLGLNKQKSIFFDINSKLIYALPFSMKSKLISGEFSYRGKIEGINDELANIPSLGFIENDQSIIGQESAVKMHGYGLNLGINMRYNYRSFSAKFGLAYYNMGYRNLQYQSGSYVTKQINDYQSSFFGVKNISSNSLALCFGIGYIIK